MQGAPFVNQPRHSHSSKAAAVRTATTASYRRPERESVTPRRSRCGMHTSYAFEQSGDPRSLSNASGEESQDGHPDARAIEASHFTEGPSLDPIPLSASFRLDGLGASLSIDSHQAAAAQIFQLYRRCKSASMSFSGPPGGLGGRRPLRERPALPGPRAPTPHPLVRRGLGSNLGGGVISRGMSPGSAAATHGSSSLTPARQASPVPNPTHAAPRGVSPGSAAATHGSSSLTPVRQVSPRPPPTPAAPPAPVYILGTAPIISRRPPSPPSDLAVGPSNRARELFNAQRGSRPPTHSTSSQMNRLDHV